MFEWLSQPEAWGLLFLLTSLEIVLGVDNIIFIAIATSRLPQNNQNKARILGLFFAMFTRIALLFSITWIITLQSPLIQTSFVSLSGKDIFLIMGGIFLLYKSLVELKDLSLKTENNKKSSNKKPISFLLCIFQITLLDIVFSLDSIITAVGILQDTISNPKSIVTLATIAIIIAVFVMIFISGYISNFINQNPSIKLLAICILVLIGLSLISDGIHHHIPKNMIYSAISFSFLVELIRIYKLRKKI
ncbi:MULTISPECIES: TerC family protein [unclassified Helicobacter]|uniref:TerC family protein n=1 Tax=unclassified Helicobacter TaxID=2593540 RepID=UPI000CF1B0CC|nr:MULTISPECIES: TerC family protein [unclassified Helicobacter]